MKEIKLKIQELIKVSAEDTIGTEDFLKRFDAKMKRQEELIAELKVLAKAKGTLLGRTMQFPMADSYALYVILRVNKTNVVVYWLNWCDGWQDDRLGECGSLPLKYAQETVWGRDRFDDFWTKAQTEKYVAGQPPTGTAEAVAVAVQHEMKSGKNPDFIYYNEKKL